MLYWPIAVLRDCEGRACQVQESPLCAGLFQARACKSSPLHAHARARASKQCDDDTCRFMLYMVYTRGPPPPPAAAIPGATIVML